MKKLLALLFSVFIADGLHAQISGPTSVMANEIVNYTYTNSTVYASYNWGTGDGSVLAYSRSGTTYSATIQWTTTGTKSLSFVVMGSPPTVLATLSVTVSGNCMPANPVATFGQVLSCGSTAVTYTGSVPGGVTWYWQTSSTGMSTTASANPYVATATGTYYLRAKSSTKNCWSASALSVAVTVNAVPAVPTAPTIPSNTCGPKIVTLTGTPPGGTGWYWQGTAATGTDYTSGSATATSFSALASGTYYLGARTTAGCWSYRSFAVTVNYQAPPLPNSVTYCESDILTLNPAQGSGSINWYNAGGTMVYQGLVYTPANLNIGTYVYTLYGVSATGCVSATSSTFTLNISTNCDTRMNWSEDIVYTYADNINPTTPVTAADSRTYLDGFGNEIQSQQKLLTANNILAAENIYDKAGTQALTTLPAPINQSAFAYRYRFSTNVAGARYSASDFDLPFVNGSPGELSTPNPVGNNGLGTLGWYYSTSNTLEPKTAITGFPYSRTYKAPGPNTLKVQSASPGDAYRMGASHESAGERALIGSSELAHYAALKNYFTDPSPRAPDILNIAKPVSGAVAAFTISGSASVTVSAPYVTVTCNTGSGTPGVLPIQGTLPVTAGKYYTLKVKGYKTSSQAANLIVTSSTGTNIVWPGPAIATGGITKEGWSIISFLVPTGVTGIKVGVLWSQPLSGDTFFISDVVLQATDSGTSIGYKLLTTDKDQKQAAMFVDADGQSLASALVTSATGVTPMTYDNWSYFYYNDFGQLIASVTGNGIVPANTNYPGFVTTYKYDHHARLIETTSPDQGTSQFVYSFDGKLRFSQNQDQRNSVPQRFSYTNYDYLNRPVESGEYLMTGSGYYVFEPSTVLTPAVNSVLSILEIAIARGSDIDLPGAFTGVSAKLDPVRCRDYTFIKYELQSTDAAVPDASHLIQNNISGGVSKTQNANATTWYSYDEWGQLEWTVQNIVGLGVKTVDYTYDFSGNITVVSYQKGQSDAYNHFYTYDADSRLKQVYTSSASTYNPATDLRATYYYYLHGPLKRVELANNLQGIDYVYDINGNLKSINHADPSNDPGGDTGIAADVFGETLNYYTNDYTSAGGYKTGNFATTGISDNYGGKIKSAGWFNKLDWFASGSPSSASKKIYGYTYDKSNQLTNASWGTVSGTAAAGYTGAMSPVNYQETIGAYDKNGNIQSLVRGDKAGSTTANYNYSYQAGTNKLLSVDNSVAQSTQCVSCAQIQTPFNQYITTYGNAGLANTAQLTSYLNTALSKTFTDQQYQSALMACNQVSSSIYFYSSYISFGHQPQYVIGTSDFSVEAWVKIPTGISGNNPILTNQKYLGTGNDFSGFHFSLMYNKVQFYVQDGTGYGLAVEGWTALTANVWHHVVVERTGSGGSGYMIFIDGVQSNLDHVFNQYNTNDIDLNGTLDMKIGSRIGSIDNNSFNGQIKDVRLYKRPLTNAEIVSNYNNGCSGVITDQTALLLWAPLSEGSGITVKDRSSYGQIGSYVGSGIYWVPEQNPAGCVKSISQVACQTDVDQSAQFSYNSIGQLIQEIKGSSIMKIQYNAFGLTSEIRDGSDKLVQRLIYDDKNDLIKKLNYNVNGEVSKTTFYVHDISGGVLAIYEQNANEAFITREMPIYGLDRIGVVKWKNGQPNYFYEIKDHLGNVRSVIGSLATDTFTATMEPANSVAEDKQFINIAPRVPFAAANSTGGGSYVIRVNNGQSNGGIPGRIAGPGITLKVAPGDVITVTTTAYYEGGSGYSNTLATSTIASAIAAAFGGVSGVIGDPGKVFSAFSNSYTAGGFAGAGGSSNDAVPAAYLNMLMFDANYLTNPGTLPMSSIPVTSAANFAKQTLTIGPITIPSPGYIYIYVNDNSNTNNWVYFDDLAVTQVHSPVVSGGDYYPFGLPMGDRSVKAERYKYGYQGQFSEKDSLTGWNSFELRMYEPRYGRWLSTDPQGQFASPFTGMGNNPANGVDPDGGLFGLNVLSSTLVGAGIGFALGAGVDLLFGDGKHWLRDGLIGAAVGGTLGYFDGEAEANANSHGSPNSRSVSSGKLTTNEYTTPFKSLDQPTFTGVLEKEWYIEFPEKDVAGAVVPRTLTASFPSDKTKKLAFTLRKGGNSDFKVSKNGSKIFQSKFDRTTPSYKNRGETFDSEVTFTYPSDVSGEEVTIDAIAPRIKITRHVKKLPYFLIHGSGWKIIK